MMDKKRGQIRALFAGAVLLASLTAPRAEDKFSAGEMLSSCQAIEDSAKTAKNLDELELDNSFTSGTCWGAFLSIQQFIVTKVEGGKTGILANLHAAGDHARADHSDFRPLCPVQSQTAGRAVYEGGDCGAKIGVSL